MNAYFSYFYPTMKRWPLNTAYIWERAPFLRLLLPFVLGIVVYDQLGSKYVNSQYLLAIITAALFVLIVSITIKKSLNGVVTFLAANCLLLAFGYGLASKNDIKNDPAFYGKRVNKNTTCIARITATPADKEHSWKLPVEIVALIDDGKMIRSCGEGIVYIYKDQQPMLYHMGDTLLLPSDWQGVQNAGNPYEFDHAGYLRRNNVYYQQFCTAKSVRLLGLHNGTDATITEQMHRWCMDRLDRYITDIPTKGLMQAMLLGDEVNLDNDTRQYFSDAGIVHIIAISGGNIMMFFTVIGWLLRWIKNKRYQWVSYMVALPLIWFYVVMAGASPSAIRAAIMFSILAVGILLSKNNNSFNHLMATAFILLCAQPMWLYALGFQLSFIAVLSIIIFYKPIYQWILPGCSPKMHKWLRWIYYQLFQTIAASLAAEILVAPLVVYYFHNFPVMFLMANVLAFFFMFIVLLLGMAIIVVGYWSAPAGILAALSIWLVSCFNTVLKWLRVFDPLSFHLLRLSIPELLMVYLMVCGIALLLLLQQRRGLLIGLGSCAVLLLLFCIDSWQYLQQQRFVVYNVGKENHIERIEGESYSRLTQDTTSGSKIRYATGPAHIEWRALQRADDSRDSLILVDGKRILVLNSPKTGGVFPVDYLVLNYHSSIDLQQLQNTFAPKVIVMGNNYSRKEQLAAMKVADACHLRLHAVALNGAFSVGH